MPSRNGSGTFAELSSSGLRVWGGRVHEEWLPELKGRKAMRAYREMRDNDAIVGAILFAIEQRIRKIEWWDEPVDDSDEAKQAAEYMSSVREDMSETWEDTISEILSMLPYGWAYLEIVYKLREGDNPDDPTRNSQYDDGYIAWRKLPLIPQDTLDRWDFSDDESLQGIWQRTDKGMFHVPVEKGLLFRTQVRKRNPEGRSVLRNAWRSWYMKRRIENIEGVGIERDLAGLPHLTAPDGVPIFDGSREDMVQIRAEAEQIVRNIRRDEQEGILTPYGWDLKLLSTGGRRQFDTSQIIERYDRRMAMVTLQDAILIGHEHVGSYALADAKTDIGALALVAWPDMISAVFNMYAYPRLWKMTPFDPKLMPELKHGDLEQRDLVEFADYLTKLVPLGIITPGEELESVARDVGGLPPKPEETPEEVAQREGEAQLEQQRLAAEQQALEQQMDGQVPTEGDAVPIGKHLPGEHNQETHGHGNGQSGAPHFQRFQPGKGRLFGKVQGKKWAKDLTPEEKQALADYQQSSHGPINAGLRGGKPLSLEDQARVKALDSALDKATVPRDIIVHRIQDDPKLRKMIRNGDPEGQVIRDKGYPSTSLGKDVFDDLRTAVGDRPQEVEIRIPKGRRGGFLDGLGHRRSEEELLLPRGTKFKILDAYEDEESGTQHVTMEAMP